VSSFLHHDLHEHHIGVSAVTGQSVGSQAKDWLDAAGSLLAMIEKAEANRS
jgi:hypothetical protein